MKVDSSYDIPMENWERRIADTRMIKKRFEDTEERLDFVYKRSYYKK